MMSNISCGDGRRDMSANSSMLIRSTRRDSDVRTIGTASVMKPGLLPVLWTEVPPSSHACSTRARTSSGRLAGRWNSPRVVTTFVPEARSRHTTSKSQPWGM